MSIHYKFQSLARTACGRRPGAAGSKFTHEIEDVTCHRCAEIVLGDQRRIKVAENEMAADELPGAVDNARQRVIDAAKTFRQYPDREASDELIGAVDALLAAERT